jgi:hypothetical protein
MIHLIGISGKLGSGKDTVARLINEITGNSYEVKRFAGKLKLIASLLTGIPVERFEDQDFKNIELGQQWNTFSTRPSVGGTPVLPKYNHEPFVKPMTVRELLQKLGTNAVRDNLHVDAWVNALFADFKENAFWIVPDTRFPNEFNAIKTHSGVVIRVNRGPGTDPHPSETALDYHDFDYVIDNSGTLEELRAQVLKMLAHFNIVNAGRIVEGVNI